MRTSTSYILYILKNNGTVEKITFSDTSEMYGLLKMYLLSAGTIFQSNAFASKFVLYDLQKLCKPTGFTDGEADALLRGITYTGLPSTHLMPNLIPKFNDPRWKLHANAVPSADGNTLTLNATGEWQNSYVDIPVLPNNKYELKCTASINTYIHLYEQNNDRTR
jgi:hypothetical protein